jgi:hypothetical protein
MVTTYDQVHEWMAQANVVILFIVFALIFLSLFLERKKKWMWHGNSMIVIMLTTTLLVIVHMIPSFVEAVTEALSSFDVVSTMGVIHGLIGIVTLIPGIWLVWMWAIGQSSETKFCAQKKKLMWKILALWLLSLGLGLLYYVLHLNFG